MKKFLLLVLISLLFLSGCGKKEEQKKEKEVIEEGIVINGVKYELNQEENEYGIKFMIASNFDKKSYINSLGYFSELDKNDNSPVFVIRVFKYENKTIKEAIKDLTDKDLTGEEIKVGDVDYTYVKTDNDIEEYFHKKDKYIYAFTFIGKQDISKLKNEFLNNIVFD